jgi:hypothetical protein
LKNYKNINVYVSVELIIKGLWNVFNLHFLTLINSPSSHCELFMQSYTLVDFPDDWTDALKTSGNWVDEWLPHIVTFFTLLTHTSRRLAMADWAL